MTHTLEEDYFGNVSLIAPNEQSFINTEQPYIHYIQVGLKVWKNLEFSQKIITFKDSSYFCTLKDNGHYVFFKV